jgi:membrane protease YdiL (CAAX protease family)
MSAAVRSRASDTFSTLDVILLFVLLGISYPIISDVHRAIVSANNFKLYWVYDSAVSLLVVAAVAFCRRPRIILLSRLRPKWVDLVALPVGILVEIAQLAFMSAPVKYLGPPYLPENSFVAIVLLAPFLEEVVFEGIFLKSLKSRMRTSIAVIAVTALEVVSHSPRSWGLVFPTQFILPVLYVVLGDSLPAAILCHFAMNATLFLPLAPLFRALHKSG